MNVGPVGRLRAQMNVTPMIDVLLVLIIIFMMLTPSTRGERAEIPQPSTTEPRTQTEDTVVIEVLGANDGRTPIVRINQREVSWDKVGEELTQIFSKRAEKIAF